MLVPVSDTTPIRPEDIPAELVAEIQAISGLGEATVREIAAFEVAARRIGFWERLVEFQGASITERVHRLITPRNTTPLPAWTHDVLQELGVDESTRSRGEALLRRLMALVGPDESAVRTFLKREDPTLHIPVEEAVQAHGLGALDQLLRDIAVGGSS